MKALLVAVLCLPLLLIFTFAMVEGLLVLYRNMKSYSHGEKGLLALGIFGAVFSFNIGLVVAAQNTWPERFQHLSSLLFYFTSPHGLTSGNYEESFQQCRSWNDHQFTQLFKASHLLCVVLGVLVAMSKKAVFTRPESRTSAFSSFFTALVSATFFAGSYVWFQVMGPVIFRHLGPMFDVGTEPLTPAYRTLLGFSHYLAFLIGGTFWDEYHRGKKAGLSDNQYLVQQTLNSVILTILPELCSHGCGAFELSLVGNFTLRGLGTLLVVLPFSYYQQTIGLALPAGVATYILYAADEGMAYEFVGQIKQLPAFEVWVMTVAFMSIALLFLATSLRVWKKVVERPGMDIPTTAQLERSKDFPPPFPNGWYKIAYSNEVPQGEVKPVYAVGHHLAVFRGKDGRAGVLDAFCPHLGANIAVGGKVVDNSVECPFHGWSFDRTGACTKIPYTDAPIPSIAKTKSWPVCEQYGIILAYFDADNRMPTWEPPALAEIDVDGFVKHGNWGRDVAMHIQDFAENSTDFAHFTVLHKRFLPRIISEAWEDLLTVNHKLSWETAGTDSPHIAYFRNTANLRFRGKDIPRSEAHAEISFIGPGGVVYFRFFTPFGRIILRETFTPIRSMYLRNEKTWWAEKHVPSILVAYVVNNYIEAFQDDIMVWQHKTFAQRPLLVKGDGPMMPLRRWYSQFYSEGSEKFRSTIADETHACSTASGSSQQGRVVVAGATPTAAACEAPTWTQW
eukprot:TRINITY_DN2233_c0_g1_i1.p1 TRINITY_DN2233_c0_g1~~TRINITY_DN2233_c0_g1_i1.p1  ORF type:complete len:733 (+),score=136.83 TRINITY_DN2233_c0_g1_i1:50-2248(+)